MTEQQDDLDMIAAQESTIIINGSERRIEPLKIGQIPAFTRSIRNLGGLLDSFMAGNFSGEAMLGAIADHGEDLIEAASIAAKIPREELEQVGPDEFFDLILAIIAANRDFFIRKLSPKVKDAAQRLALGAGRTPFKP